MRFASIAAVAASLAGASAAQAQPADASLPIPNAGNWQLQQRLPLNPGRVCTVRSAGPEVNTTLVLNDDGHPILILARPDWADLRGQAHVELSIDGAPPFGLDAAMVHNLVLVPLADDALVQRLRGAEALDWTLPFGRFESNVAGLGSALDTLTACRPDPDG